MTKFFANFGGISDPFFVSKQLYIPFHCCTRREQVVARQDGQRGRQGQRGLEETGHRAGAPHDGVVHSSAGRAEEGGAQVSDFFYFFLIAFFFFYLFGFSLCI